MRVWPSANGASAISNDVDAVRGIANSGPIVSMIAMPRTSANRFDTRELSAPKPPALATTMTPRIGRPTADTTKPTIAAAVRPPASAPRYGGKMRLPAPKNIEKNVMPTTMR